jgi:hypothetical protein
MDLLETTGLIVNPGRQHEYLQRTLPFYRKLLPADYRVEVELNGTPARVLQAGRGVRPSVLRFQFIDTALAMTASAQSVSAAD